jgi:hypothetical protein
MWNNKMATEKMQNSGLFLDFMAVNNKAFGTKLVKFCMRKRTLSINIGLPKTFV